MYRINKPPLGPIDSLLGLTRKPTEAEIRMEKEISSIYKTVTKEAQNAESKKTTTAITNCRKAEINKNKV